MEKIISQNLKKLREVARYTQQDLANALGITRSAYSNYENGLREIPYDIIEKASDFFGCEMTDLFEENASSDTQILITSFRTAGLSESDAVEVLRFKDIVKSYLKMEKIEAQ